MSDEFTIIFPAPYEKVGWIFNIKGLVPVSWLDCGCRLSDSILLDFIDINGRMFKCGSANVVSNLHGLLGERLKCCNVTVNLGGFSTPWVIESYGMITIRFRGQKIGQDFFLPVSVRIPTRELVSDQELIEKQKTVAEKVLCCQREMVEYMKERTEIWERRKKKASIDEYNKSEYVYIQDYELNEGVANILQKQEPVDVFFCEYFREEDEALNRLNEKYQQTIELAGLPGGACVLNDFGFHFIIHSNDHGCHLHAIHKGQGIDVRISFPALRIDSYIKGKLKRKVENKLIAFLNEPENYKKLEREFLRKGDLTSGNNLM